jgi:prevent-host-death family protein
MKRRVSIVEARRDLGRLAEEVRRTGQAVVLTKRGRAVARLAPEAATSGRRGAGDAFAPLRGTVRMNCSFEVLQQAVRGLRSEFAQGLERRATSPSPRRARTRG